MNFKKRESLIGLGFLAVGKFGRRKMLKEGTSISRGRQRMVVSIYISVWLRTWA